MNNTRRYKLKITNNTPHGVSNAEFVNFRESIEGFTGSSKLYVYDNYEYVEISLTDLALLTEEDFRNRTSAFLLEVNVDSIEKYNELLSESGFYLTENDPDFQLPNCQLNITGGTIIQKSNNEIKVDGSFGIVDGSPVFQIVKLGQSIDLNEGWVSSRNFTLDSNYTGKYRLWVKHWYFGNDVATPECYDSIEFSLNDYSVNTEIVKEYIIIADNGKRYKGFDIKYEKISNSLIYDPSITIDVFAKGDENGGKISKIRYDGINYNNGEKIHTITISDTKIYSYITLIEGCDGNELVLNSGLDIYSDGELIDNIDISVGCSSYVCLLNNSEDMVVNQINTSTVEIVDVGGVNGTLEYSIYEDGLSATTWQNSPQFNNLLSEQIYSVDIRDIVDGNEICRKTKSFKLNDYDIVLTTSQQNIVDGIRVNYVITVTNKTVIYLQQIPIPMYSIVNKRVDSDTQTIIKHNNIIVDDNNVIVTTHNVSTSVPYSGSTDILLRDCDNNTTPIDGGLNFVVGDVLDENVVVGLSCGSVNCLLNSSGNLMKITQINDNTVNISDYGNLNGDPEFTVFEKNTTGYTWQSISEFSGLIDGVEYVAKVRDNLYGDIICEIEKEFMINDYTFTIDNRFINENEDETIVEYEVALINGSVYNDRNISLDIFTINGENSESNAIIEMLDENNVMNVYSINNTLVKSILLNINTPFIDTFYFRLVNCLDDFSPIDGGIFIRSENNYEVENRINRTCEINECGLNLDFRIVESDNHLIHVVDYGIVYGEAKYRVEYEITPNQPQYTEWVNISGSTSIYGLPKNIKINIIDQQNGENICDLSKEFLIDNYNLIFNKSVIDNSEIDNEINNIITVTLSQPIDNSNIINKTIPLDISSIIDNVNYSSGYVIFNMNKTYINENLGTIDLVIDTLNNNRNGKFSYVVGLDCGIGESKVGVSIYDSNNHRNYLFTDEMFCNN